MWEPRSLTAVLTSTARYTYIQTHSTEVCNAEMTRVYCSSDRFKMLVRQLKGGNMGVVPLQLTCIAIWLSLIGKLNGSEHVACCQSCDFLLSGVYLQMFYFILVSCVLTICHCHFLPRPVRFIIHLPISWRRVVWFIDSVVKWSAYKNIRANFI
jgi:hypothetical protein